MDLSNLNTRSRDIFRRIVESYLDDGTPIGSRTLSRLPAISLSPASIRNVMADLEDLGLLAAPHTSAGRIPTEIGLRLFVDGLLEVGNLTQDERERIEGLCGGSNITVEDGLAKATAALSGLSQCASVILAPKHDAPLRHLEFVALGGGRALVVIVLEDGSVENRVIALPPGLPAASLVQAGNFLSTRLVGRQMEDLATEIRKELAAMQGELDTLTRKVVEAGLAVWAGNAKGAQNLIVRGRANLLDNVEAVDELERIRMLFDDLETKQDLVRLLELAGEGEGVKIFIGAESKLFSLSGSSLIVSPYMDGAERIVGVIGVIGPTRLNYARIIPMVDYTAQVVSRLLAP